MSNELIRELNEVFPNDIPRILSIRENISIAEVLLYPGRTDAVNKIKEDILNSLLLQ